MIALGDRDRALALSVLGQFGLGADVLAELEAGGLFGTFSTGAVGVREAGSIVALDVGLATWALAHGHHYTDGEGRP